MCAWFKAVRGVLSLAPSLPPRLAHTRLDVARPPIRSDAMQQPTPMAKRRFTLVAAALALLAALPTPARGQGAQPTVTVTIIGISVSIWPAIVADQKGFFTEE